MRKIVGSIVILAMVVLFGITAKAAAGSTVSKMELILENDFYFWAGNSYVHTEYGIDGNYAWMTMSSATNCGFKIDCYVYDYFDIAKSLYATADDTTVCKASRRGITSNTYVLIDGTVSAWDEEGMESVWFEDKPGYPFVMGLPDDTQQAGINNVQ